MSEHFRHPDEREVADLLESAYAERVDMEVAARHLWSIHRAAGSLRSPAVARTRRALVSVLAGSMLFMSSGGALAASVNTLPGDVLYTVKRGVEQARIALTVSSEGDARLHLALARRRLAEARSAAERRPEVVQELVRDALDSIEVAERTGGTQVAGEVEEARRETSEQLEVIVVVLDETEAERAAGPNRKQPASEDSMALSGSQSPSSSPSASEGAESASPSPSESASADASPSASASASPSEDASASPSSSPSASASPSSSEEPEGSESPSPSASPSESDSPSPSASPSASETPSPTTSPSESESPSPSASPSPSETESSGPTRKYESLEPDPAPEPEADPAAAPAPAPAPGPSPAP